MVNSRNAFLALAGFGGAALLPAVAHAGDFSGTRVGVSADYLWGKVAPSGFTGAGDAPLKGYDVESGGGGVSISHDWQSNKAVFGVFASATFTSAKGSTSQALTVTNNTPSSNDEESRIQPVSEAEGTTIEHHGFDTDLSALYLVGGRAGMVVNDNTLLYVQAAAASGRLKIRETGDNASASSNRNRSGYAVGVGMEVQLNDKWSAGVAWNHYDLGKASFSPSAYGDGKIGVHGDVAEVSLKYRF